MVEINIKLVETNELKSGRGGGKKGSGERYSKYVEAVRGGVAEWIADQVSSSKSGVIRVRTSDLAGACGMQLRVGKEGAGLHQTSLYWGFKYALFGEGYVVGTGRTKANEPVLVIRKKGDKDVLPESLRKEMGAEEVPEEVPGAEAEETGA